MRGRGLWRLWGRLRRFDFIGCVPRFELREPLCRLAELEVFLSPMSFPRTRTTECGPRDLRQREDHQFGSRR